MIWWKHINSEPALDLLAIVVYISEKYSEGKPHVFMKNISELNSTLPVNPPQLN